MSSWRWISIGDLVRMLIRAGCACCFLLVVCQAQGTPEAGAPASGGHRAEPQLRYYCALLLGREPAAIDRSKDGREQFNRAAVLFPGVQSPLLSLSQLFRNRGDYENASSQVKRYFSFFGKRERTERSLVGL